MLFWFIVLTIYLGLVVHGCIRRNLQVLEAEYMAESTAMIIHEVFGNR